jgi:hypothetical protein
MSIDAGEITFGDLRAQVQLIGSFAASSQSWMWAWANEQSEIPQSFLMQSLRLKEIGQANNIVQFTTPCFESNEKIGHIFSMIASGLFGASGFYPADYGEGTLFVTLYSPQIEDFLASRTHVYSLIFSQFISGFSVNHKKALYHYLTAKGFAIETDGNKIVAKKSPDELVAEFDDQNRLLSLNGNIDANKTTTDKPKKKWWFF